MEKHNEQRRLILRNALTAGCALALPTLLSGCGREEAPPSPEMTTTPEPSEPGGMPAESSSTQSSPDSGSMESAPMESGSVESGTATDTTEVQSSNKLTKAQAQYQEQPKGDQQCSSCLHFVAEDNTCKVVAGQIDPQGWCILWVKQV